MKLTKEQIDKVFEEAENQSDCVIALYRIVHPEFDKVEIFDDFPRVGTLAGNYIFDKAIAFDKRYHPNRGFPGGLWMNNGFSTDNTLKPWEAVQGKVTLA